MQPPTNILPNLSQPSHARWAAFNINVRSFPYLADHGFQDVLVLPGSVCIQMALLAHEKIFQHKATALRAIGFQNPVILSDKDIAIKVKAHHVAPDLVEYAFVEQSPGDPVADDNPRCFAKLEVVSGGASKRKRAPNKSSLERFKRHADSVISGEELYQALRNNGNQYGPRFQTVSKVWRAGDRVLARVSIPNGESQGQQGLHPVALDSVVHVAAARALESGRTFALASIDSIEIHEPRLPEHFWVYAKRYAATNNGNGFAADIVVFDESGRIHLELRRVAIAYLNRNEAGTVKTTKPLPLCVASTFTAEPLEDSLKFWANSFGFPIDVRFASYGQVFQSLLDGESAFHHNQDGFNVVLLALEDWIARDRDWENRQTGLRPDRQRLEKHFNGSPRCLLPNGLEIVHFNQYETDYLYREIFRNRCYLRHGIELKDDVTVIDIGANIGLFSLFVMTHCQNPKIYAFEPSPVIYDLLTRNCEAYGTSVRTFQCGVSQESQEAEFTFYENSSVFSSFHPDPAEDKRAIDAIVHNTIRTETAAASDAIAGYVTEFTADRLHSRRYRCRLVSLSSIVREQAIEKIDLLKIDAERCEVEILNGIDDSHWPLIDQIVIEVHDSTNRALAQIEELLVRKGYHCTVTEEKLLEKSGLFNIYASRRQSISVAQSLAGSVLSPTLERSINEFCTALDSFMARSGRPLLLCVCPRVGEQEHREILDAAEQSLLSTAGKIPRVHPISSTSILNRFPLVDYDDPHSHALAAIPYTAEGYAAIGTVLFQKLVNLESGAPKVIVLDCDDTLWKGACGEDGPRGIRITKAHRALQEFVVELAEAGVLVCLCSKNNERDVFDVFDQRNDMVLKREHLTAGQINWNRKSVGIKALAEELNLSLQSFVFLDNDPLECAEVRAACPEVLTLQLPPRSDSFRSFLKGIWNLGRDPLSDEDRSRTKMYGDELRRQEFHGQTLSLKDFLSGLQLRVDVRAADRDQLARVAQLTFRTNQFNFTTIRRSEEEIKSWLENGNRECLVACVSDRFGDYGLVGALLYEITTNEIVVDTFLVSCRALGRGVEHQMLTKLAEKAEQEGKTLIELPYVPTERNAPVLEFISSLGVSPVENHLGRVTLKLLANRLTELYYDPPPESERRPRRPTRPVMANVDGRDARWFHNINRSEVFQKIADELCGIEQISKAIRVFTRTPDGDSYRIEPGDTLETAVMKLWKRVLRTENIRLNNNFFDIGGTSLKAVHVIALIQKELGKSLSVTSLFECPTISLLAAKLNGASQNSDAWAGAKVAQMRGRRRRLSALGISRK